MQEIHLWLDDTPASAIVLHTLKEHGWAETDIRSGRCLVSPTLLIVTHSEGFRSIHREEQGPFFSFGKYGRRDQLKYWKRLCDCDLCFYRGRAHLVPHLKFLAEINRRIIAGEKLFVFKDWHWGDDVALFMDAMECMECYEYETGWTEPKWHFHLQVWFPAVQPPIGGPIKLHCEWLAIINGEWYESANYEYNFIINWFNPQEYKPEKIITERVLERANE